MKRVALCGLLVLGLSLAAGAQRLPDTVTPHHYILKFMPDLKTAKFAGEETIHGDVNRPTHEVVLNALEIEFQKVTVQALPGGPVQGAKVTLQPESETATFTVDQELPKGPVEIKVEYTGILNDQLRGFYLSKSDTRRYAMTQMEPTDARRAFPCWDEPAYKAPFNISVVADRGDTAISNGKIEKDEPGPGPDQHTITFAMTPKMSTYLVALGVGDFKCVEGSADGIPIRICTTPDKVELGKVALESAEHILHFYNQYYSIKYPYGKLDVLASPDFSAGAMENTADIVYREVLLLVDERTASPDFRKLVADVLAHEMAHQWFGDLVTMKWWDDIWLNEGFATWMSPKPVRAWHPEWNNRLDEVQSDNDAKGVDSLLATRAIRTPANTPAEISALFDGIAYNKTAAVLRMVESYVGPETYRQGVNQYLQEHAYGNATAEDFWNTIAKVSGKPVDKIMKSFVDQPGVPLVSVATKCAGGSTTVELKQQRFFSDRKAMEAGSDELWQIPVCLKTAGASGREETKCELLTQKEQSFTLKGCAPWIAGNAGAVGYYRTAYAPADFSNLTSGVARNLSGEEQVALAEDQWAMVRAGRSSLGDYLQLAESMKDVRNRAAWETIDAHLQYVGAYVVTEADRAQYQAWLRNLLQPTMQELGWKAAPEESADSKGLRATIAFTLGYAGHDPEAIAQARRLVEQAMSDPGSVDATLLSSITPLAAMNGDAALYEKYLAAMKAAKSPEEYYRYFFGLAEFRRPELVERNLQFALTPEVRNQDATGFLEAMLRSSDAAKRARVWAFIKSHWPDLEHRLASYTRGEIFSATSSMCDAGDRDDVQAFYAQHRVDSAERTVRQSVERMNNCIDMREQQGSRLASWLKQQPASGGN
jgi:aminopeptidase N/puromycin-sensitive aminopeptidase